jgi:Cu2+-containing amine oxidase
MPKQTSTMKIEQVDIDVCYGDYDGHVTRDIFVVTFYKDNERYDCGCYKTKEAAETAMKEWNS